MAVRTELILLSSMVVVVLGGSQLEGVKKCSEKMGLSSLEQTGKVGSSSSIEVSNERRTGGLA